MKSLNSLKNYSLALIAMTFVLGATNAQSRYKHVPRVKVDGKTTETVSTPKEMTTTSTSYVNVETNHSVAVEPSVNVENTTVASTNEDVVVVNNKTNTVVKHNKVVKNNKKADHNAFTKTVKNNSKLMDVKDVKKSNLEKWLLYMIICLAIAVVFTILAVALAYALLYSGAYFLIYIFWALAGLAWIGAVIFLILGLTGIM